MNERGVFVVVGYFAVNNHQGGLFFFFVSFSVSLVMVFFLWGKVVSDVLFRFGVCLVLVVPEPFVPVFPRTTKHLVNCNPSVHVCIGYEFLTGPASIVECYRWVSPDEPDEKVA